MGMLQSRSRRWPRAEPVSDYQARPEPPLANSLPPRPTLDLQPSHCVRHIAQPMSPGRPNAHSGCTPSPTSDPFAPQYPEKSVTLPRHPFPALPHPTPRTPHQSSRLRHFSPPIRPSSANFATALEPYAHPCYPRPREGPTPRPGNPVPTRGKAPGIRRGVENWPPATDPPPVLLCHVAPLLCPNNPAPALQNCAGPPTGPATSRTECRRN